MSESEDGGEGQGWDSDYEYEYGEEDSSTVRVRELKNISEQLEEISKRFRHVARWRMRWPHLSETLHWETLNQSLQVVTALEKEMIVPDGDYDRELNLAYDGAVAAVHRAFEALVAAAYVIAPAQLPMVVRSAGDPHSLRAAVVKVAEDAFEKEYRPEILESVIEAIKAYVPLLTDPVHALLIALKIRVSDQKTYTRKTPRESTTGAERGAGRGGGRGGGGGGGGGSASASEPEPEPMAFREDITTRARRLVQSLKTKRAETPCRDVCTSNANGIIVYFRDADDHQGHPDRPGRGHTKCACVAADDLFTRLLYMGVSKVLEINRKQVVLSTLQEARVVAALRERGFPIEYLKSTKMSRSTVDRHSITFDFEEYFVVINEDRDVLVPDAAVGRLPGSVGSSAAMEIHSLGYALFRPAALYDPGLVDLALAIHGVTRANAGNRILALTRKTAFDLNVGFGDRVRVRFITPPEVRHMTVALTRDTLTPEEIQRAIASLPRQVYAGLERNGVLIQHMDPVCIGVLPPTESRFERVGITIKTSDEVRRQADVRHSIRAASAARAHAKAEAERAKHATRVLKKAGLISENDSDVMADHSAGEDCGICAEVLKPDDDLKTFHCCGATIHQTCFLEFCRMSATAGSVPCPFCRGTDDEDKCPPP
jgi:hypothetical protein